MSRYDAPADPATTRAAGGAQRGPVIDLNADLGESYGRWTLGDDAAMIELVSSANVACGFHAGDPATLWRTVCAAAERGVTIGAQVSYPDLAGFGRRFIDIAPDDLTAAVVYQIGALDGLCRAAGTRVRYVKPHGALYHALISHDEQAAAVVAAITAVSGRGSGYRGSGYDVVHDAGHDDAGYDAVLPILTLPGSAVAHHADKAGIRVVTEAFADRGYTREGTLVPRGTPGAVLDDPERVADRVARLVTDRTVVAVDGSEVTVAADSVCLHGDSPGAVAMARAVRTRLAELGVVVSAVAG